MTVQEDEVNQKHVAALDNTLQYWLRIADIKEEGEMDFEIAMAISTLCLAVQSVMLGASNSPNLCPQAQDLTKTPEQPTRTDRSWRMLSGRERAMITELRQQQAGIQTTAPATSDQAQYPRTPSRRHPQQD